MHPYFPETHQLLSQVMHFIVYHTSQHFLVRHSYIFWPSDVQSSHRNSHYKQPAFSSEFQSERLLQQSEVNHSMLLKVHQQVLIAVFHFMYNGNIAS